MINRTGDTIGFMFSKNKSYVRYSHAIYYINSNESCGLEKLLIKSLNFYYRNEK